MSHFKCATCSFFIPLTRGALFPLCQWLMPVILGTLEAEIRTITVQSQSGQIVCDTLSRKTQHKKTGLVEWLKW
jgi:hypothetical protein